MPAFIGDLLTSWRVRIVVDLPTRAEPGVTPGLNDQFASSLEQKLVLIRPCFLLAWDGSRANANRIIYGILARVIALRFGSRAMALHWVVGTGLEQSWDDGFEAAYPEPDGFRKCDRLLFRA
jgi:hypothetical protein